MNLYINACVRKDSRTNRLALALLQNLGNYTELKLEECRLQPLLEADLKRRSALCTEGSFDADEFAPARQFANADTVVVAAPYWDLSFPALLKLYLENICVMGICSRYDDTGRPVGLCKAKKLYYVTTAGGKLFEEFGYGQMKALAENYFGIKETALLKAEYLDIQGNDAEEILQKAIAGIPKIL